MSDVSPFFIAIAGGTGSGKSMFARMLRDNFPDKVLIISHDMYYKDQSDIPFKDRKKANMDVPDALDNQLLIKHLKELKQGKDIDAPIYNFAEHKREKKTQRVSCKNVIVVEGLLSLATKPLRDQYDLKIYIEVDPDLRLARRILRDVKEKREPNLEQSIEQYLSSAYPMHYRYVIPQKDFADLVIPWNKKSYEAVETVSSRIEDELEERGVVLKR